MMTSASLKFFVLKLPKTILAFEPQKSLRMRARA